MTTIITVGFIFVLRTFLIFSVQRSSFDFTVSLYLVSELALTVSVYNFFGPPLCGRWYWGANVVVRLISNLECCVCHGWITTLLFMSSVITFISSPTSCFVFVVRSSKLFVRLTKMLLRVLTQSTISCLRLLLFSVILSKL